MNQLSKKQMQQEAEYNFPYHYLDLISEEERWLQGIEYMNHLEIVKNLLKPYNGQLILDAGCGDGRFCYELKKENVRVVGVDLSKRAIDFAKAFNPDVEFFVQDMGHLHLPYKFDYVVLKETLEHFVPEKIPTILQNLSSVLKKEGKLIITVPSVNKPLPKKHYQHFTKEGLSSTLEPHFRIVNLFGYSRMGYKRSVFTNLRRVGILLYPFRNKTKIVKKFFVFINNYYKQNLAVGDHDKCLGLIAVCEKTR